MTSELRFCANEGNLVNRMQWLPTEPFDFDWGRINPRIGCNNIRCSGCGECVSAAPVDDHSRRYQCRCTSHVEKAYTPLAGNPDEFPGEGFANPGWACAGHPALTVPSLLDGVQISTERLREVARTGFASPPFEPPESSGHAIWVSRLYWILPERHRPALGEAVAELLLDDDQRVAVRAMNFYYEQRMAQGNERLTAIYRDHGARLATIADPDHAGYTVEDELLSALKFRGFRRDDAGKLVDPEAHELLREAMRRGKNADEMIYTFGRLEPEWLAANAAEIVKNAPKLLEETVWLLRKEPDDRRLVAYRAIAALGPAPKAALLERIDAEFKDEERAQIIAGIESNVPLAVKDEIPGDDRIGRRLAGRFTVTRWIGMDKLMGVAVARDEHGKLVRLTFAGDVSRSADELRRVLTRDVPGLAPVVYLGPTAADDGWAPGSMMMAELLPSGAPLDLSTANDPTKVAAFGARLAAHVANVHRGGTVLGTIRPESTYTTDDGELQLIARGERLWMMPRPNVPRPAMLSPYRPGFRAPELLLKPVLNDPDPAADVYSIGAMLATLLLGRPVFEAEAEPRLIAAQLQGHHEPLPPTALGDLLSRCLRPNPAERPSLAELEEALRQS